MISYEGYVAKKILFSCRDIYAVEPKADFSHWNETRRAETRNCFSFACNAFDPDLGAFAYLTEGCAPMDTVALTFHIPRPGTTGGRPLASMTKRGLMDALRADGFIFVSDKIDDAVEPLPNHALIACSFANNAISNDYHFQRFDEKSRTWYHKPDFARPVTNKHEGAILNDPSRLRQVCFQNFVGYFLSPPDRAPMSILVADKNDQLICGVPSIPLRPVGWACTGYRPNLRGSVIDC